MEKTVNLQTKNYPVTPKSFRYQGHVSRSDMKVTFFKKHGSFGVINVSQLQLVHFIKFSMVLKVSYPQIFID